MAIRSEVVVLGVSRYKMVDRNTGELVQGAKVRYILASDLTPVEEENFRGFKMSVNGYRGEEGYAMYDDFPVVPGIYGADINFKVNESKDGKGETTVTCDNFKFIRPVVGGLVTETKEEPKADSKPKQETLAGK